MTADELRRIVGAMTPQPLHGAPAPDWVRKHDPTRASMEGSVRAVKKELPRVAPGTRPSWGDVLWPPPDRRLAIVARWFCIPEHVVEGPAPRRGGNGAPLAGERWTFGAYCGAPPGVRCRCGAQRQGHDPGDEDPGEDAARRTWRPAP